MNRIVSHDILSIIRTHAASRTEKKSASANKEFFTGTGAGKSEENQNNNGILSLILDQSDEIVFVIDDSANIVFVNRKTCELLGYGKDDILKVNILDIAPNIEEEILVQSKVLGYKGEGPLTIDMFYRSKDNVSILVEVEILPIISVGDYFLFRAKSISEHSSLHKQMKSKESDFLEMIEHLPVLVLRYNTNLTCTYVNEACEKITGYHRFKILERPLNQTGFLSQDQISYMEHNLKLVQESGLPIEFETIAVHKSSISSIYLQMIIVPEFNEEGKIAGTIVVAYDLTASKHKESELVVALKKLEDDKRKKSFFLNSLGHNMFDVLNALLLLSQLLKDESLTSEKRSEFIRLLDESTKDIVAIGIHIHSLLKGEPEQTGLDFELYKLNQE